MLVHKGHLDGQTIFHISRLYVVNGFIWTMITQKILILGKASQFQIWFQIHGLGGKGTYENMKLYHILFDNPNTLDSHPLSFDPLKHILKDCGTSAR